MALSLAGPIVLMVILVPILISLVLIVIINVMQEKKPKWLPQILRNWDFLPIWMHSLEPIDKLLRTVGSACCGSCADRFSFLAVKAETPEVRVEGGKSNTQQGNVNPAFHGDDQQTNF